MRKQPLVGLITVLMGLVGVGEAQKPVATFPVIVVFHDNVPLDQFRGVFQADERAAAAPEAWEYLDRRVAGAVQQLERGHGFRADHVFSSTIRGFSARLNLRQMQALENNPLVAYLEPDEPMFASAQTLPWGINREGVKMMAEIIGERPAGEISADHPLVELAVKCTREQGLNALLTAGSTDANIPLSRGMPAVVMGITTGGGAHTINEYIDVDPVGKGLEGVVRFVELVARSG